MKKIYLLLSASIVLFSCSGDDSSDNPGNNNNVSTADYLPLTEGNYWVYNVENSQQQSTDHLYIAGNITADGHTYKKFTTQNLPTGLFTNAVYNDGIRKEGDQLLLTGNAEFGFSEEFSLSLPITDFVILKENAAANQQLATASGTITQPYSGYELKFEYTLSTKNKQDHATYVVGSKTYSNVKQVETTLNLKVTAMADISGIGIVPVQVMTPQNVVVSNQYYADGIGVIFVSSDVNYSLLDFSAVSIILPIPQSASEHQEETLTDYVAD